MIAVLVRFFGVQYFDLVEDMVQSALAEALDAWKQNGVPENPGAWIHRVAKNRIVDSLRRDVTFRSKSIEFAALSAASQQSRLEEIFDEDQLQDNLLRLIFVCCHPDLPPESSIPLTLKTVCGFSDQEVARGLLLGQDSIRKRVYRAKQILIKKHVSCDLPPLSELVNRLDAVHNVLYLMFNEGYCSSNEDEVIRLDVCEEAARLCHLLTEHESCCTKTTKALLALMLFHAARFQARVDHDGQSILLEEQDRSLWDQRLIAKATQYMAVAASVDIPSPYHLEAAIALQHCHAKTFEMTNWTAIIKLYDRLWELRPSPIYQLNKAIAICQRDGPDAAISELDSICDDARLNRFHLLDATYGEFYRRKGMTDQARFHFQRAIELAHSAHDIELLKRRLIQCEPG